MVRNKIFSHPEAVKAGRCEISFPANAKKHHFEWCPHCTFHRARVVYGPPALAGWTDLTYKLGLLLAVQVP